MVLLDQLGRHITMGIPGSVASLQVPSCLAGLDHPGCPVWSSLHPPHPPPAGTKHMTQLCSLCEHLIPM